jgi:hypothetical protein
VYGYEFDNLIFSYKNSKDFVSELDNFFKLWIKLRLRVFLKFQDKTPTPTPDVLKLRLRNKLQLRLKHQLRCEFYFLSSNSEALILVALNSSNIRPYQIKYKTPRVPYHDSL